MATKKPTRNTTRSSPPKRAKGSNNNKKPASKNVIRHEVKGIVTIAASILLLVSLFADDAGLIGRLANALVRGLFGLGAYMLAVLALIIGCIVFAGRAFILERAKVIMGAVVFILLISIANMIGSLRPYGMEFWQYMGHAYLNGAASNGGLFGAMLSSLFVAAISTIGTYILFITTACILIMQITGRSLFAAFRASFFFAKDRAYDVREKRHIRRLNEERAMPHEDYQDYQDYQEYQEYDGHDEYEPYEPYEPYKDKTQDYTYIPPPKKPKNLIYKINDKNDKKEKIDNEKSGAQGRPSPKKPPLTALLSRQMSMQTSTTAPMAAPMPMQREESVPKEEPIIQEDLSLDISVKGIVEGYAPEQAEWPEEEMGEDLTQDITREVIAQPPAPQAPPQIPPAIPTTPFATPPTPFAMPKEAAATTINEPYEYIFPPVELLKENTYQPSLSSRAQILENSKKLEETLQSFGVAAKVVEVSKGPTVTRYELSPGAGVKVSKISGLADDLALNLAAAGIRIEAPIPGKAVVGIEIPNKETQAVFLREVIDDDAFWGAKSNLSFAMGKDIAGNIVIADIAKMPHLLIAGATGAGKSVCINTLITSIIYKASPNDVKLLMIDPKVVELSVYNGIPHLLVPVVTDPKKASGALAWAVREMDDRYNKFAETRVRDLAGFNAFLEAEGEDTLPQVVIIIDELADLMMTCGKEVEESICRLAQKARAAGIHLIIATQRPSVDVITGLIKANVPSRLAFAVSSGTDSRTILDMTGAEKLLGKGDMLFSPVGLSKPQRIQGSLISDKEVENIVNFIKQDNNANYDESMMEKITALSPDVDGQAGDADQLLEDAIAFIVEREKASTSMLQRRFRIGYNRAARMMEELVSRGLVGPEDGAKPRKVLMTAYQYREYLERKKAL